MKAQGEARFITIPANGSLGPMEWPGTGFRVLEATDQFYVAFDDSPFLPATVGLPYDSPALDAFSKVRFQNRTGSVVNATIYAGTLVTRDERKVFSGTVDATLVPADATPEQFLKTSTAAAAPVALSGVPISFRRATVLAKKALDGTDNAGNVRIGPSGAPNEQPFLMAPGDEVTLQPAVGQQWDFADWFLDVDNDNDGVVVIYS